MKILVFQFALYLQMRIFVTSHLRECLTPLNDVGKCVSLKSCPEVLLLYQKLPEEQATKYSKVLRNLCDNQITFDKYPMVCCRSPNIQVSQQIDYELIPVLIGNQDEITEAHSVHPTTTTDDATESVKIVSNINEGICSGPNNEIGFCKPLENCSELLDAIRNDPSNETLKDYLRISNKICDSYRTNVCCPSRTIIAKRDKDNASNIPKQSPTRILPLTEDEGCGRDHHLILKKIIGGQESEIGSWPWIALLGYNPYSMNPFRCGGTLITSRHVLTAAHCILADLSFVRLGEHDLSIEDETTYIDLNIINAIVHENYSKTQMSFDIALLYLDRTIDFTDAIYPICLPISDELRNQNYVSSTPFAAGWGRTSVDNSSPSDVLHEVQLLVHENHVCEDAFKLVLRAKGSRLANKKLDQSVLCVGDLLGKKDTCKGDSGGPLMVPESYKGVKRYYLIGITSYGISCAKAGVPSIYTSTQYFANWILQKIQYTQDAT